MATPNSTQRNPSWHVIVTLPPPHAITIYPSWPIYSTPFEMGHPAPAIDNLHSFRVMFDRNRAVHDQWHSVREREGRLLLLSWRGCCCCWRWSSSLCYCYCLCYWWHCLRHHPVDNSNRTIPQNVKICILTCIAMARPDICSSTIPNDKPAPVQKRFGRQIPSGSVYPLAREYSIWCIHVGDDWVDVRHW